jgi:abortive infection bacteriophage resistance protein
MIYTKKPTTIDEQILKLKKRGLIVSSIDYAQKSLKEIGYFRLENYWHVMQIDRDNHVFKGGQTFERSIILYQFDKDLRNLIFKYIEKIEISFRTKMVYYLSHDLGAWWFEDIKNFKNISHFEQNYKYIKESIEKEKNVMIL